MCHIDKTIAVTVTIIGHLMLNQRDGAIPVNMAGSAVLVIASFSSEAVVFEAPVIVGPT
jgi:hypothetical protein